MTYAHTIFTIFNAILIQFPCYKFFLPLFDITINHSTLMELIGNE